MDLNQFLRDCAEIYERYPLLIPSKVVALGASLCLKRGYFALLSDFAPSSHMPYSVSRDSVKIHDLLAYLLPGVTYRYLHSLSPRSIDINNIVEETWKDIADVVETYSNVDRADFNNKKLKPILMSLLKGYLQVLNWLTSHGGFSRDLLVFTERWLVSTLFKYDEEEEMPPIIGVPDVVLVSGDNVAVIDWKIIDPLLEKRPRNEMHYIQLILYEEIIRKLTKEKGKIYSFLIYTTPKKGNIKVASFVPLHLPEYVDGHKLDTTFIDEQKAKMLRRKAKLVAALLYGMAFCRGTLEVAANANVKELGIRAYNPLKVEKGRRHPCNYCEYREWCEYKFAKKEQLPPDIKKMRQGFAKLSRTVLEKKSSEYKKLVEFDNCVEFDKMYFNNNDPRELILEKTFEIPLKYHDEKLLNYSLGRTTVYLFLRDKLRGDDYVFSPALFGRYEDDEVELLYDKESGLIRGLRTKVRMISTVFAVRWLPLYFLYRELTSRYHSNALFEKVKVCKGTIPMNIEMRALNLVERALVQSQRDEWYVNMLREIVSSIVDEYA